VTAERAARLYRLLQLLGGGPQSRSVLTRRLRLDMRGFYRDLQLLRRCGITVALVKARYSLVQDLADALGRLPFPDPHFTLREAVQLARGRTQVHRKLRDQIQQITG
jgi:hypothetical protein